MNDPRAGFDQLLAELRPKLHRYCSRMTGSVIDGEDVLQEALVKAIEAFPRAGPIASTLSSTVEQTTGTILGALMTYPRI